MSKCKRALSLLLVVLMMLSLLPVSALADDGKVSVVINYVFENGTEAAPSWTATLNKGSSLNTTVTSPAVVGYTPDQASVALNYSNIQKDVTIKVTYKAADVGYTVKRYLQNVNDDGYTLDSTERLNGYTEQPVGTAANKSYPGFTELLYDTTTKIAADGSTEVEIYYDRNYYLLSLDLQGGYGAEPVYARYGAPISIADPEKAGYTFGGWDKDVPTTMPAGNMTLTAKWNAGKSTYLVQYWLENANDDGYSYDAGSTRTVTATVGSTVSGSNDKSFTGFHYDRSDQNVTVNGDGTTVVNVYYKRDTYTLTFKRLTCTRTFLHTHSDGCYKIDKTFSGIKIGADTSYWWNQASTGYVWYTGASSDTGYSYPATMPGNNLTVYGRSANGSSTIYYYENGTQNEIMDPFTLAGTYAGLTEEDFVDIPGFKYVSNRKSGDTYYIYYTRLSYKLDFNNRGTIVKTETVPYEKSLTSYYFVPEYPTGLEAGAYKFDGWYTDPGFMTPVNWNTATMPYKDTQLYAKWTPITHTVRTYQTENGTLLNTWPNVPHRSTIEKPADPTNDNYTFVGWFYKENDVEKAFDFSMAITKDLDLYAKWSSNKLVEYTIKYQLEDDGTVIAKETKGSALAGTTKTFDAKGGDDLYADYREGYFPKKPSHSITMDINGTNEFTFVYVSRPSVPYTVKYLEAGTNKELKPAVNKDTKNAIVTEKYEQINGYMPDAVYKRLVVKADGTNEIIFYYTKDEQHAPVITNYFVQTADGSTYEKYSTTTITGEIGNKYKGEVISITGFEYNPAPTNPLKDYPAKADEAVLTESGLEFNLYYDRISCNYIVKHVDADNNDKVISEESGSALFGSTVYGNQGNFDGYMPIENQPTTKQLTISANADDNVIVFKYYQCFYVGHVQSGALIGTDTLRVATHKNFNLTAQVTKGYLYGGAFSNAACDKDHVQRFTDGKNALGFTPEKGKTYYIWEVDQKYLTPKTASVWRHVDGKETITRVYLMTAVDRLLYQEVGFNMISNNNSPNPCERDGENVAYGLVDVMKNGKLSHQFYVLDGYLNMTSSGEAKEHDDGYIGMYKLSDNEFNDLKTTPVTYQPYWTTLDGIKVTGTQQRTCTYKNPPARMVDYGNNNAVSSCAPVASASTRSLKFIASCSYDADPNGVEIPEETGFTVTVNDNGSTYDITANKGDDITGKLSYAGADGKLFAGWFTDENCTVPADLSNVQEDMTVYAKYVSDSLLQFKFVQQRLFGSKVYLFTSIDSTDFKDVGFVLNGEQISANYIGSKYSGYSARLLFGSSVGKDAKLVVGSSSTKGMSRGDTLTVTPYWVTADGTTVYGTARMLTYGRFGTLG